MVQCLELCVLVPGSRFSPGWGAKIIPYKEKENDEGYHHSTQVQLGYKFFMFRNWQGRQTLKVQFETFCCQNITEWALSQAQVGG